MVGTLRSWVCVVCAQENVDTEIVREGMFCQGCQSSWRVRAIALGVLLGTRTPLRPLPFVQSDYSWRGIGTSEHMKLVGALGATFDYTNTYYQRFPKLDLLDIPAEIQGQFCFVICSDVLEHIAPPVETALLGIRSLLNHRGFAVLSVPQYSTIGNTMPKPDAVLEYYPEIVDWHITKMGICWTDHDGQSHIDDNPEFHGGGGGGDEQSLTFRLWGSKNFVRQTMAVGFTTMREIPDFPNLGVPRIPDAGIFLARV